MKVFFLIFMVSLGHAAAPIPIPEPYKPYMELIEALYTTEDLTFGDAFQMVEPIADELGALRRDPQIPHLLFLSGQKAVFETEAARLEALLDTNPELEQAWFLMWNTARRYESIFFERGDFTILNSGPFIARFFATIPTPITDIVPLHIHKLLFLMYISQFLGDISYVVNNTTGFFKNEDYAKPFLQIFDRFLKETGILCGNKLFEHALWILREHVVYVGAKQEEKFA